MPSSNATTIAVGLDSELEYLLAKQAITEESNPPDNRTASAIFSLTLTFISSTNSFVNAFALSVDFIGSFHSFTLVPTEVFTYFFIYCDGYILFIASGLGSVI